MQTDLNQLGDPEPEVHHRYRKAFRWTVLGLLLAYLGNTGVRSYVWLEEAYGVSIYVLGLLCLAFLWAVSGGRWTPFRLAITAFSVYLVWGLVSGSEPVSDFSTFAELADTFGKDPNLQILQATKSPATVAWFSLFSTMLGPTLFSLKVGAATAWAITGGFLMMLFLELGLPRRAATFAAMLFAFAPGVIAYSSVISSESVLLATLAAGLYFVHVQRGDNDLRNVVDLFLSSLLMGVAFMAIPNALLFFAAYVVMMPSFDIKRRRRGRPPAAHIAAFLVPVAVIMLFQIGLNYRYGGDLSPSPSPYGGMALLTGTNQDTNGAWALEDMELAGFSGPNKLPFDQASSRAVDIAVDRVLEDPIDFLEFAVGAKVTRLWRGEDQLLYWSVQASDQFDSWYNESQVYWALRRLVNGYFGIAVVAAFPASVLVWRRRLLDARSLPIGLALLGEAALFLVVGVQQRYHLLFMPFLFGLIALAWANLRDRREDEIADTAAVSG